MLFLKVHAGRFLDFHTSALIIIENSELNLKKYKTKTKKYEKEKKQNF